MWGATQKVKFLSCGLAISIHAPRVRCDWSAFQLHCFREYFNPRTSCEVRLWCLWFRGYVLWISIHAPRVRCDCRYSERRGRTTAFQSTHLVWGATLYALRCYKLLKFQSTHLVWGATAMVSHPAVIVIFQSTHLVWGATQKVKFLSCGLAISIHAPRVRCDKT